MQAAAVVVTSNKCKCKNTMFFSAVVVGFKDRLTRPLNASNPQTQTNSRSYLSLIFFIRIRAVATEQAQAQHFSIFADTIQSPFYSFNRCCLWLLLRVTYLSWRKPKQKGQSTEIFILEELFYGLFLFRLFLGPCALHFPFNATATPHLFSLFQLL